MNSATLIKGIEKVTAKWCKQKKSEERRWSTPLRRRDVMTRTHTVTLKEVAFEVMEAAYLKASSGGTLPAHARQIMYAARGEILQKADRDTLNDQYFTQTLLPEYMRTYPERTASWDVVFDARGHFIEPHVKDRTVSLGTIGVRNYCRKVANHHVAGPEFGGVDGSKYPTYGPRNRFGAILFIEKEGFMPLFEETALAKRYDLGIMSTKGVSNVAARQLIDRLHVPVFVLHDFDEDGFKIYGTLRTGTARYRCCSSVQIIDLGLRLKDVEECDLEWESTTGLRHSRQKLRTWGATDTEISALDGDRVELNAFTSGDLIEWIERKLDEHGVKKVVPDRATLESAYRRTLEIEHVERAVAEAVDEARKHAEEATVPDDLEQRIRERLEDDPERSWDDVVADLVDGSDGEESDD